MDSLLTLVVKRLAFGVLTLFVISVLIAIGVDLLPGDLAQALLGQMATPEAVAAIRLELGLDQPLYIRYFHWLSNILQGDMGTSLANHREVTAVIGTRLANSVFLATVAAVVATPLSVFLGILAALYRETLYDKIISMSTLMTISFPDFFVAYILMALFSVLWNAFPSMSAVTVNMEFGERLYTVALPALTLILVVVAHMMRMTRAAIINVLNSPFIETAQLKGMTPAWVVVHHALPNVLSPIINVIVLELASMVVGVVVVEVVFVYPGLGQLMVDSVSKRDLPVVQASALIFAGTYVLLNLAADILAIVTNPRLRHPS